MKPELVFDPAKHRYTLGGIALPSVTGILKDVLGEPCAGWGNEEAMERGRAAHALYAILGRGEDLSQYTYDARLQPYVDQWRAWQAASGALIDVVECAVASETYYYAGTLDAIAGIGRATAIIDYKATMTARDAYQLAAYCIAYGETSGYEITAAVSVQIRPDGWKMSEMITGAALRRAKAEWLAINTVARIKKGMK